MVPVEDPPCSTITSAAGFCCFELDNLDQVAIAAGDGAAAGVLEGAGQALQRIFGNDHVRRRIDFHGFLVRLTAADRPSILDQIDSALDVICVSRSDISRENWPITARAGIAWSADDPQADESELGRRACAACAAAKEDRTGRCTHGSHTIATELRARLVCDMLTAMEEDRLKIFAQEIKSLSQTDPKARQYEVLIQITDCSGFDHPPSDFVALAEKSALIEILDRWIIRKALLGHADLLRARPEIALSLNLSGRSLGQPGTWPFLEQTIAASGIAPSRIQLEITETSKIGDMAQAAANVRSARAAGIGVALDDFGAGLSGFGYLTSFDVNCIKIDGSLVPNVVDDGSIETEILRSIMTLAHRLGLEVVAEHVSSPEILAALKRLGVCKVQGFEVGMPRLLTEILMED